MGLIHEIIPKLIAELGHIPKNGQHPNYKFRKAEDVIHALHPMLIKYELGTTVNVYDVKTETILETIPSKNNGTPATRVLMVSGGRVVLKLFAKDGSFEEFSGIGRGVSYGEAKDGNIAMTLGWKYAVALGLNVPFKDLEDESGEAGVTTEQPAMPAAVNFLALAQQATTTATAGGTAVGQPNPFSVSVDGPCSQSQVDRVIELAKKLSMPPEAISGIVQRRNKQRLAELTDGEIREVITKLEYACKEKDIPF